MKIYYDENNNLIIDWSWESSDSLIAKIKRYINTWMLLWGYDNDNKIISLTWLKDKEKVLIDNEKLILNWYIPTIETENILKTRWMFIHELSAKELWMTRFVPKWNLPNWPILIYWKE